MENSKRQLYNNFNLSPAFSNSGDISNDFSKETFAIQYYLVQNKLIP